MNIKFAFDIFVRGAGGESRKNWNEGKTNMEFIKTGCRN